VLGCLGVAMTVMVTPMIITRVARHNEKLRPRVLKCWNVAAASIAGGRFSPAAFVEHTGRKSGRVYTTPLTSPRFGDGFLLPLPYGPQVDWCRNTVAAGRPYWSRHTSNARQQTTQHMTFDSHQERPGRSECTS
jgi:hypothetical protein